MEELRVDKFSSLITELEKIIARLEKEIEAKEEERDNTVRACNDDKDSIPRLKENLEEVTNKLDYLKLFQVKNLFLKANKETISYFIKFIKAADKKSKAFIILGLLILISLSLTSSPTFLTVFAILAIFQIVLSIMITYDIKKERKLNSISDLEKERDSLEEKLTISLAKINSRQLEIERLNEKINTLNIEKEQYQEDLNRVIAARSEAIEGLVSNNALNQAFASFDAEEIMERVRKSKRSDV